MGCMPWQRPKMSITLMLPKVFAKPYYDFNRASYPRESLQATRLRGVGGAVSTGEDQLYAQNTSSKSSSAKARNNTRFHKVQRGETLSSIARKRNTTVAAICKLNRIGRNMKLRPGQILKYN